MVEEPFRRQHRDLALGDLLGADDPGGAAEVVDVTMGVDEAGDRALAAVLAVEGERRSGGLGRDQRVDDDDPALALDHVHVREIEAAQLVEARCDLEEAGDAVEAALAPEARVGGLRALLGEEVVGGHVPDDLAAIVLDPRRFEAGDEAALGVGEVLGSLRRQRRRRLAIALRGDLGGGLAPGAHATASASALRRGAAR